MAGLREANLGVRPGHESQARPEDLDGEHVAQLLLGAPRQLKRVGEELERSAGDRDDQPGVVDGRKLLPPVLPRERNHGVDVRARCSPDENRHHALERHLAVHRDGTTQASTEKQASACQIPQICLAGFRKKYFDSQIVEKLRF